MQHLTVSCKKGPLIITAASQALAPDGKRTVFSAGNHCHSTARAMTDFDAGPCQPGPAKRKRLLALPALPIAQQPCCADTAVPALTIPATATSSDAPRSQLGVATAAAQSAPPLPISTPLAKQSQRQLKTPFARLSAWPVDASARKASQLLKPPEAAVEQPTLPEAAPPPALARPLQVTQQGLVSEAGPRSLHVNVLPMRNSKVTPAEAVPPQPGPAGAVSASAAEQADGSTARASAPKVAASAQLPADSVVCSVPASAEGVHQEDSNRAASAPAEVLSAAVAPADDVDALVSDDDIAPRPTSMAAAVAPLDTRKLAAGHSLKATANVHIAQPSGERSEPPPAPAHARAQQPSNLQAAASSAQHPQCAAMPPSEAEPHRRSRQAPPQQGSHQPSPRRAALPSGAGSAMPQPLSSQRSEVPAMVSPVGHEAEVAPRPHLPRLAAVKAAVTAASLPSVDEVLASFAIPDASALIGKLTLATELSQPEGIASLSVVRSLAAALQPNALQTGKQPSPSVQSMRKLLQLDVIEPLQASAVTRGRPFAVREANMRLPASSAIVRHCKPLSWSMAADQAVTPPPRKAIVTQPGLSADETWHEQHREMMCVLETPARRALEFGAAFDDLAISPKLLRSLWSRSVQT